MRANDCVLVHHWFNLLFIPESLMLLTSETKLHTNFRSYNFETQPQIYQAEISCIILWSEVHNCSWDKGVHAKRLSGLQYSLIRNIQERRTVGLVRNVVQRLETWVLETNWNVIYSVCKVVALEALPSYFWFCSLYWPWCTFITYLLFRN
jgi:hypothetical protein